VQPIPNLKLTVVWSDLGDLTHEFVAKYVALFHEADVTVHQVQVRTADGARRHLDDGVAPVFDLGIRNVVAADIVLVVPTKCFLESFLDRCL
jgi:hypothetical protein